MRETQNLFLLQYPLSFMEPQSQALHRNQPPDQGVLIIISLISHGSPGHREGRADLEIPGFQLAHSQLSAVFIDLIPKFMQRSQKGKQ